MNDIYSCFAAHSWGANSPHMQEVELFDIAGTGTLLVAILEETE